VLNDTRVIPARLEGRAQPRGEPGGGGGHACIAVWRRTAGRRSCGPERSWRPATASRSGKARIALASWVRSTPRWWRRARAGKSRSPSTLRARPRRRHRRRGAMPLAALHRRQAGRGRARPRRLPDRLRPRGRLGGRARPRACTSRRNCSRAGCGRRGTAFVTLHVGAGTFLPVKAETWPSTGCTPSGARWMRRPPSG
jgi:hypothetical protein